MHTPTIGIIIGSTRNGRFGEHPARWIHERAQTRTDIHTELIDLRDYPLPFLEDAVNPSHKGGVYGDEAVTKWAEAVKRFDAYIIVTPEYNRSTSGVLKNALDHIYGEFAKKPVGFVAYGSVGGARAVEQLRLMAIEHQMAPVRNAVHINAPWFLRTKEGTLLEGAFKDYEKQADTLLEDMAWWSVALQHARGNQS